MNREECLKELMSYGYTFEEACKYHKAICKQHPLILADFRFDLAIKIGSNEAEEVYHRLTSNWEDCGISHAHSLCYSMMINTMRNLNETENEAYTKALKNMSNPTGRTIKL